jgi:hypothetical protein
MCLETVPKVVRNAEEAPRGPFEVGKRRTRWHIEQDRVEAEPAKEMGLRSEEGERMFVRRPVSGRGSVLGAGWVLRVATLSSIVDGR